MAGVLKAIVVLSVMPGMEWAEGQRAPCYECEVYKDSHPQSRPYEEIRSHCSYPCECPAHSPTCAPGMSVVRDGCGCCSICARQPGEACDGTRLCDEKRGLVCQYPHKSAGRGVCQVIKGLPCTVYNRTYDNGETFLLDCRTQCACQNGTYACSSLCPQEAISPRGSCKHPRLVEVPGQCCREWMCDSATAQRPPECRQQASPWTLCSSECGLGLSHRVSNMNPQCLQANETRLCQLRVCGDALPSVSLHPERYHHVRKGHECKATQRVSGPVRLRFGPCKSRKRFRPKFCGSCAHVGVCCTPQLSTTIKVDFRCHHNGDDDEDVNALLLDLAEPRSNLWYPDLDNHASDIEDEEDHNHLQQQYWIPKEVFPVKPGNDLEHKVTVSLQLILRCQCTADLCQMTTPVNATVSELGTPKPTTAEGEIILHRVHRTTAP